MSHHTHPREFGTAPRNLPPYPPRANFDPHTGRPLVPRTRSHPATVVLAIVGAVVLAVALAVVGLMTYGQTIRERNGCDYRYVSPTQCAELDRTRRGVN